MNRGFYLGVLTGVAARVRTFLTFWPTPANAAAASLATIDSSSTHSFAAFQQQPADVSSRAHQQQQQHHQQSSLAPSVFSFTRKPAMPTANTAAVSFSTASFSSSAAAPSSLHAASNQPSSAASASSSSSASSAASPSPSSPWIDALRTRFDIVPLSADALTADQIAQAHAMLLRCTLTREPLVAQVPYLARTAVCLIDAVGSVIDLKSSFFQ